MHVKEKLTNALSLPKEIALDMPLIMATGRGELNIENYKNLLEFSETKIRVHTAAGLLIIEGTRLHLKQITAENLFISGNISGMYW
ncbi:MAG: YabP/YqfC family sporulation protein [Defluviitaleaceae bacterium]|nr:YabP/YqfC family sporulation protein [Defluviitaleaceae bacterium]MCL2239110.1 YabP/YqfC family sporulation protein [Defluviitaleaceae bacterium]